MSAISSFDARAGDRRAPAAAVDALLTGQEPPAADREALRAAGALTDTGWHPRLEDVRATVAEPRLTLTLERGERRARVWRGADMAVLVHPLPEGAARLALLPPSLLVDAIVRLNDIGPRPRVDRAVRIVADAGGLATALAARDADLAGVEDPEAAAALEALVAAMREHWRVTASWDPAEGALDGRVVEVLDTEAGYWMVIPDGDRVELWPATPSAVYRAVCALFPLVDEVRA
jgi:hypothetical protein